MAFRYYDEARTSGSSRTQMKSDDEEYKLYEKIYLAEAERKEKLMSRLNLPLAMIVALLSFLSYLLSKSPRVETIEGVLFWIAYLMAGVFLSVATAHFSKAWRVRKDDLAIPTAEKLENHRKSLLDYYEGNIAQANGQFMQTMMEYYIMGATRNATNNDSRSAQLDQFSKYVIYAVIASVIAFIPAYSATNNKDTCDVRSKAASTASTTDAQCQRRCPVATSRAPHPTTAQEGLSRGHLRPKQLEPTGCKSLVEMNRDFIFNRK